MGSPAAPPVANRAPPTPTPSPPRCITAALQRITGDAELRTDLRERGLQRAAQFSWERAARETLALYRQLTP